MSISRRPVQLEANGRASLALDEGVFPVRLKVKRADGLIRQSTHLEDQLGIEAKAIAHGPVAAQPQAVPGFFAHGVPKDCLGRAEAQVVYLGIVLHVLVSKEGKLSVNAPEIWVGVVLQEETGAVVKGVKTNLHLPTVKGINGPTLLVH